ncbi:hypothetical protein GCM10009720_06400 [Yaniella flava]|uniref:Acyl-CoA dehydrogenase/oxidase C-terminal domain-containing protein n=1 Tax=Yaniella flava TaxID=287930 RepID=A0ABN2U5K2_9MICC
MMNTPPWPSWWSPIKREVVSWCRELLGGNGIVLDEGVMRHFTDAEALYSFEGTREMNSLIVGRSITGKQAFV